MMTSRRLRWLAPAGVAAAVAVAALTSNVAAASGTPKLPARTAAELLAAVQDANPPGMSGTIVETAKLGLPALPAAAETGAGGASLSLQSLVTGSHTIRFWYAGEARQRIAVLGDLSESDVVHNGKDLWTYTSQTHRVTHSTVRQPAHMRETAKAAVGRTPKALAEQALAAIDPTTGVEVDTTARVAGRSAYQLLLKPRDERSLVGSVRIAIDAQTSVPLRVQVFARGAGKPAIEVGFTDVSFKVPDASVFTFVPPAGTTVTEEALGSTMLGRGYGDHDGGGPMPQRSATYGTGDPAAKEGVEPANTRPGDHGVTVLGKGWTAVAVIPSIDALSGQSGQLLNRISEPATGGRLITSALVSVFISDNGRIYAGSVTGAELQKVAATGSGL